MFNPIHSMAVSFRIVACLDWTFLSFRKPLSGLLRGRFLLGLGHLGVYYWEWSFPYRWTS